MAEKDNDKARKVKARGLGKGLDSLISSTAREPEKPKEIVKEVPVEIIKEVVKEVPVEVIKEVVKEVPVEVIKEVPVETTKTEPVMMKLYDLEPNRNQPRKSFDEGSLLELAESMKSFGIIQPLLVRKKDEHYEIVAGERRYRAAKLAGLKEVPVLIGDYPDKELAEIALIENIQRKDLNPIEEAEAYGRLIEDFELTQEEVAERLGKSRTAVTNSLRLLKLAKPVRDLITEGLLSAGHGKVILALSNEEDQVELSEKVVAGELSVRETEQLVKTWDKRKAEKPKKEPLPYQAEIDTLTQRLTFRLGSRVDIVRKSEEKGKIVIDYFSKDELERLVELIGLTES